MRPAELARIGVALALAAVLCCPAPVRADAIASTHLLDLYAGSDRSALANRLRDGGYELAGGAYVDLDRWYAPKWRDTTVLFLTRLGPNLGVIWGMSTGEEGAKYSIQPALHAGLAAQWQVADRTWLTFQGTVLIGGLLSERPCVADYGVIGGVQDVNCRLAATVIPPAETLRYLVREPGWKESRVSVTIEYKF